MGISGLLPALKPIQQQRRLSEYKGKTIAVDGYGWLHKSIHTCPEELAKGKPTHRFVDYVMHRVRLLKYHGITPYIVLDGGPLPAKKATENERRQRREEHRKQGEAYEGLKKLKEARESYLKSIDVSPQMAYQLIKALKAEGISYVVAPYEADAQLAYLQKAGLVDAILSEDSDLLVFGCSEVLYKFSDKEHTVVSISRSDFGAVHPPKGQGYDLREWSDDDFRRMAILSGCDYLPSIPGIGLKTAYSLLKENNRSVKSVVKTLRLDGKKRVPSDYLEAFKWAEMTFLHQRVWCPLNQQLVHLTPIHQEDWTEDLDAHVGGDMDPNLARLIAQGDVDPTTFEKMHDINPAYHPGKPNSARTSNLPSASGDPALSAKAKGKLRENPQGGIRSFFGPNPIIPPRPNGLGSSQTTRRRSLSPIKVNVNTAVPCRGSGKRTLAEAMDHDQAAASKKHRLTPPSATTPKTGTSKFFQQSRGASLGIGPHVVHRRHSEGTVGSGRHRSEDKENIFDRSRNDRHDDDDRLSKLSVRADVDGDTEMDFDNDPYPERNEDPVVKQLDGYISPNDSDSRDDIQDLSSPAQPRRPQPTRRSLGKQRAVPREEDSDDDIYEPDDPKDDYDDDAPAISSPVSAAKKQTPRFFKPPGRTPAHVQETPTRAKPSAPLGYTILPLTSSKSAPTPNPTTLKSGKSTRGCLDLRSSLHANDNDDEVTELGTTHHRQNSLRVLASSSTSCTTIFHATSISAPSSPEREIPGRPPTVQSTACIKQTRRQEKEIILVRDSSDEEIEELEDTPEARAQMHAQAVSNSLRAKYTFNLGVAGGAKTPVGPRRASGLGNVSLSASTSRPQMTNKGKERERETPRGVMKAPLSAPPMKMRRSETNVTAEGAFALMGSKADGTPLSSSMAARRAVGGGSGPGARKGVKATFPQSASAGPGLGKGRTVVNGRPVAPNEVIEILDDDEEEVDLLTQANARVKKLNQFRCV